MSGAMMTLFAAVSVERLRVEHSERRAEATLGRTPFQWLMPVPNGLGSPFYAFARCLDVERTSKSVSSARGHATTRISRFAKAIAFNP